MAIPTCQPNNEPPKPAFLLQKPYELLLNFSPQYCIRAKETTPFSAPPMTANAKLKHLSTVANDVVRTRALKLGTSVDKLVEEFEAEYRKADESMSNISNNGYSRKLVEFCSAKALAQETCQNIEEKINDGSFSRFTFDMMIAWEMPSSTEEEASTECVAKEREDKKIPVKVDEEQDDIPLFYSDLMLLLVDDGPNVGEDGFAWFASLVPLAADPVSARFTFETLTAPTGNRLFFPAYDKFLKEIDKCTKHLKKQATPKGVELAEDEVILHVEGTATSQRVVRHIGATSWPGRLTLTNYALYFEASGVITYEDAFKIDLSKDTKHTVRPASTGPWGAPLFDRAIVYESPELSEAVVIEFPEVASSTRRDHWLALIKEIMLMHRFLSIYKVECRTQAWEMHARTILGIMRLHAARELLRISAPSPTKFLIFALFDELPKGDYILEELAESLKKVNSEHPCSASSILMGLNTSLPIISDVEAKAVGKSTCAVAFDENQATLETVINQAREEEKNIAMAKATTEGLKDEGIAESAFIFKELLRPLRSAILWFQEILTWERPATTLTVLSATLIIIYKEWAGKAIASFLLWAVAKMLQARRKRINERCNEIVVSTASDQSTLIDSIVSAQHGLQTVHQLLRKANIAVLKLCSIFISKAREHADMVMIAMIGLAISLAVIPLKFLLMVGTLYLFSKTSKLGKPMRSYQDQGSRRLKEWWDSIPVIPVRVVDMPTDNSTSN